jgi:Transglycosylase SLT domain
MYSHTTLLILLVVILLLGGCSGEPEKGRFIVAEASPLPRSTIAAPSPAPTPSTSTLETIMKEANTDVAPPESAKLYLQMSEDEQYEFIEQRARHVSRMIGSGTYEFSQPSISYIKQYVDDYARRVGNGSKVTWGEDLNNVFGRAQRYAPVIIRAFNGRRIPPAIGLYLVAVETEYTNFAQENEAGAAGLFQFIPGTAEAYGLPANQRTDVDKMSQAAAHYVADRIGEFGTDPMSVALCIAGYNRSPDSVRSDLQSVMNSSNKERSFWTLVTNSNKLDKWFQGENIKYVPKYFAAAVVGETPWAFGLKMKQPLSTCTGPGE